MTINLEYKAAHKQRHVPRAGEFKQTLWEHYPKEPGVPVQEAVWPPARMP